MNNQQKTEKKYDHKKGVNTLTLFTAAALCTTLLSPAASHATTQGTLKEVKIVDAGSTNVPPTADIAVTIDGNTVTLNAADSIDQDGSIVEYKWDFGDNTAVTEGVQVTHTYSALNAYNVTLTLTDNENGVTLTHTVVDLNPVVLPEHQDAFTSLSAWTDETAPGWDLRNEQARGYSADDSLRYNTSLDQSDKQYQKVQFVNQASMNGITGLMFRAQATASDRYIVQFMNTGDVRLTRYNYDGSANTWRETCAIDSSAVTIRDGYYGAAEINGTTISYWYSSQDVGARANWGTPTGAFDTSSCSTQVTTGNYIGLFSNAAFQNFDNWAGGLNE